MENSATVLEPKVLFPQHRLIGIAATGMGDVPTNSRLTDGESVVVLHRGMQMAVRILCLVHMDILSTHPLTCLSQLHSLSNG